ncbi:MAG: IS256 family transposase [Acidimicrobiales bacterium]
MTTRKNTSTSRELVPVAPPGELVVGDDLNLLAEQLVDQARADGIALTGEGGLLPQLIARVLETGLGVEMTDHLGYERHSPDGHNTGNSRNGSFPKTVTTEVGEVELRVPRDRNGTFDPVLVPHGQRRIDGLAGQVISLYGQGLTTGEIRDHLEETYGTSISKDTIRRITDTIVAEMEAWQSRPLDPIYAVVLIDAIVVKVRDTQVANRPVYVAIGVNLDGERDVLGLWMGPTGGEGAKQWMTMLTELRNRGITDVLVTCCDGLKGLPEAIRTIWKDTTVQTCVVHMVRNSLRYASKKHWGQITKQMRAIYTAPTVPAAEAAFAEFADGWRDIYPAMIGSWENVWNEFVPFLEFPPELRKIIYTTNSIESLNARFRRAVRHRGHFPTEQAALKVLYLTATKRRKNRQDLIGKTNGWKAVLNTLTVHYGERITNHI